MARTPANHLSSEEEEEEEEEESILEEEDEDEEENNDDDGGDKEDNDDDEEEEEEEEEDDAEQHSSREKDEEGEASPITTSRSSKRIASPSPNPNPYPKRLKLRHHDHDDIGSSSQPQSQRAVWSLEDELILLNGIINFKNNNHPDPFSDLNALLQSIEPSLHLQVSCKQFKRKIRSLKDKFNSYAHKAKTTGNLPRFPKPSDLELYNLSIKIWGDIDNHHQPQQVEDEDVDEQVGAQEEEKLEDEDEGGVQEEEEKIVEEDEGGVQEDKDEDKDKDKDGGVPVTPKQLDNGSAAFPPSPQVHPEPQMKEHHQLSLSNYPYLIQSLHSKSLTGGLPGMGETLAKQGIALIQKSKVDELERRFRMQQIEETEIYLNRILLIHDQTKLILDALKSSMS